MTSSLLFVDDEEIVLSSCMRIFSGKGYSVDVARSGEEGLAKSGEKDYDIIVTDLKMPGIGGMELLKTLRRTKPDSTVVVFTGYATVETARQALKYGAFDYIPKPFTPEEIREVIENALQARRDSTTAKMLDLMAIVSHELKSPVAAVHTTADTLYRGYFGKLAPEQQKTIAAILRNCEYLEDIIRSYIDLSKMELDELDAFEEEVRFAADVINEVVEIPEIRDNIKKMPLCAEWEEDFIIRGDPRLLRIVVRNLVSNAIKYGREGTPIRLALARENEAMAFSVRNEGVGIRAEDIRKRLFKKFERLRQKGTEGVKGSGLGLYICKKIAEKHRGRILVESEPGQWIEFRLVLPLCAG